jgi:dephospho-CoA kinase
MIIGICGKVGSGKSFIGEHIAKQLGYKFVKLDFQVGQVVNIRFLKRLLQKRINHEIPKAHEHIQLFPLLKNLEKPFSRLEFFFFMYALDKKLKKIIRTEKDIVIDFVILQRLKSAKKIDKIFVVQSDNDKRIEKLGARDGLSKDQVIKIDNFIDKYCVYEGLPIINNDYNSMPNVDLSFVNK